MAHNHVCATRTEQNLPKLGKEKYCLLISFFLEKMLARCHLMFILVVGLLCQNSNFCQILRHVPRIFM